MRNVTGFMTLFCVVGLSGCAGFVDVRMRHPLVVNSVDKNVVSKEHHFQERQRGLPPESMADEASLTRLGTEDICFDVTMRELDAIDLRSVQAKLDVPGQVPRDQAQMWPDQPVARDYNGLVPQRVQTGYETYCSARAYNGVCISWQTRPVFGIVMVPGPVQVFETHARMCFPNGGFVTPATEVVRLDLTVPRPAKSFETGYNGWGWGPGDKRTVFRWGFEGMPPKK
jgi:hypothetical protein